MNLMNIFTHTYRITIFEDGKFCWKNNGWEKAKTIDECLAGLFRTVLVVLMFYLLFAWLIGDYQ